ncbi:hypothetical protein OG738_37570 [Amycolatopsis sp. NBC_01488]|uniref:hypothetical protein n=1 Tax=Amycolatopsis sp. NBC_01488 TaxID=2903563 RepID=UPI002E2B64B7|nr:hypothetical protein [Amycolatopsis sp. NBC_01488]
MTPEFSASDPAEQVAEVDVFGPVVRLERAVHRDAVLVERPVGAEAAERRLPGVAVGVDEPGQHDLARGVDDLGVGAVDSGADGRDPAVLDQHVTAGEIPDGRVHADHHAAAQECLHRCPFPRS